jgi:hypothetical protein
MKPHSVRKGCLGFDAHPALSTSFLPCSVSNPPTRQPSPTPSTSFLPSSVSDPPTNPPPVGSACGRAAGHPHPVPAYSDEKVANRDIRIWHLVDREWLLNDGQIQNPSAQS